MTPAAKEPESSSTERQEALTPEQLLEKRPANRARVDAHKERMIGEVTAFGVSQRGRLQAELRAVRTSALDVENS